MRARARPRPPAQVFVSPIHPRHEFHLRGDSPRPGYVTAMDRELRDISRRPTVFKVRTHTVVVALGEKWRWSASCDDVAIAGTFETEADAWASGVRAAERLDRDRGEPW